MRDASESLSLRRSRSQPGEAALHARCVLLSVAVFRKPTFSVLERARVLRPGVGTAIIFREANSRVNYESRKRGCRFMPLSNGHTYVYDR